MNILIWFPRYQEGGGFRLFVNLVSALTKHKGIKKIRIVLSGEYKTAAEIKKLADNPVIEICYYPEIITIPATELDREITKKRVETEAKISNMRGRLSESEAEIRGIKTEISEITTKISETLLEISDLGIPWVLKPGRTMGIYGTRTFKKLLQRTLYKEICLNFQKTVMEKETAISEYKNRIKEKEERLEEKSKFVDKETEDLKTLEESIIYMNAAIIVKEELKRKKEQEISKNPVDYYAADCDVVYFFWPHFIDFQGTTKPSVCTFQDAIILDFPESVGGVNAKIFWEISKRWIEETTIAVTSSNYVKSRLIDYFGEKCNSIEVVPHRGSPVEYFPQGNISKDLLDKLPSEYIVYPANLGFHKNHYNLLVAYSRFKYRKQYPLVLFGTFTEFLLQKPPDYPEFSNWARLTALIKRLRLKGNEDFYALGYIKDEDVAPIIKNAKALVMPSLAEGGGSYPVEEALRLGVPVACSDIPVMREHLEGRTPKIGWFDPESTDSIANTLNDVIDHYEEYKDSTMKGINDQTQSWENIADEYVKVFNIAINKSKELKQANK